MSHYFTCPNQKSRKEKKKLREKKATPPPEDSAEAPSTISMVSNSFASGGVMTIYSGATEQMWTTPITAGYQTTTNISFMVGAYPDGNSLGTLTATILDGGRPIHTEQFYAVPIMVTAVNSPIGLSFSTAGIVNSGALTIHLGYLASDSNAFVRVFNFNVSVISSP